MFAVYSTYTHTEYRLDFWMFLTIGCKDNGQGLRSNTEEMCATVEDPSSRS